MSQLKSIRAILSPWTIWATLVVAIGGGGQAAAQQVLGFSEILATTNATHIDTWSETEMDANTAYYYDAYVEGYLFQNNSAIAEAYAQGNPAAGGGFTKPLIVGDTYEIDSYHYLIAYFGYQDQFGNYYYYNPDSYLVDNGGGFNPSGWGFTDGGGPLYYENIQYIYLGATYVVLPTGVPHVASFSPASDSVGNSGSLTLNGTSLEDLFTQSTTPAITGSGMTISLQSVTPTRVVLNYTISQNASNGAHAITLATRFGTSNPSSFSVGDPTPLVSSVNPSTWYAGTQPQITISGRGFGTNPSLSITGPGITGSSIITAGDTTIQGTVTIDPSSPGGAATVTVHSNGYGSGFLGTNGGSPDGSNNTARIIPIDLPAPQIMMVTSTTAQQSCTGGTQIAGHTTSVYAGQQILLCAPAPTGLPAGSTVTNTTWTVEDQSDLSGGYCAPNASIQCGDAGQELADPVMSGVSQLTFYWLNPGTTESVTYQYCINNNSRCASASAPFTVNGPTGSLLLQPNMLTDGSGVKVLLAGGVPVLSTTGIPLGATSVGITFKSNAVPPTGVNQSFTWVQLLTSVQRKYINSRGPFADPAVPAVGLDTTYPYVSASPTTTNDKPSAGLPSLYGEGWESFSATMYLMWDPALPSPCTPASSIQNPNGTFSSIRSTCSSIPIPLSSVTWHWSGCAINSMVNQTNGTTWILSGVNGCPNQTLGAPQSAGFPEWVTIIN